MPKAMLSSCTKKINFSEQFTSLALRIIVCFFHVEFCGVCHNNHQISVHVVNIDN